MKQDLSYEAEEYIETIYRLQKQDGVAKTQKLAGKLDVVPGSVTNTIEHLEKHGLVKHEPYRGVKLTARGERLAVKILRKHRLLERLLTDVLEADWANVHDNACKLEHAFSEELVLLLEKKLGHPKACPHGNPIPTKEGIIEEESCHPLTEADLSAYCKVTKVTDERKEKLTFLAGKGLTPGALAYVVAKAPSNIILRIAEKECVIDNEDATDVWVKTMEEKTNGV
ncbi:MAG: metal-dependent transcriptional regulator [Candidatus Bathyarchaeota archaeon]|nr:metal-dependent transcriptional regulator [Candidatus Bathyarchaeota archaeon]